MNTIDEKELVNIRTLWQLANAFKGEPVRYEPDRRQALQVEGRVQQTER